jgi:hypothetical protein
MYFSTAMISSTEGFSGPLFDKIREICSPSLSMILGMLDQ